MSYFAFITVVVPVKNEKEFILSTIDALLGQEYPRQKFEILVVDGMSEDGTREVVADLQEKEALIKLLDNPNCRSSSGRNIGFKNGKGEVFLVVDGHCYIESKNMLADCNRLFKEKNAGCLCRPQPLNPPGITEFQQVVAAVRRHRVGHGSGSLIYSEYEGYVDPESNGAAYKREVFEIIGYVDEKFDACEDVEFNFRVKEAGIAAYMSPKLTVKYYPRKTFKALFQQMARYGYGRQKLAVKHPETLTFSSIVPLALFILFSICPLLLLWEVLSVFAPLPALGSTIYIAVFGIVVVYLTLIVYSSAEIAKENNIKKIFLAPAIFFTVHFALGFGYFQGLLLRFRGKDEN